MTLLTAGLLRCSITGGTVKSYADLMKDKRATEAAVGGQKKRQLQQPDNAGGRTKKMKGASAQAEGARCFAGTCDLFPWL